MSDGSNRVCVIGLDGATFDILDQWVAAGEMPRLAGLMERSSRADLISTVPPLTAPAWTSMTTGVNPGVHGLFDFFKWPADSSQDPARAGRMTSRIVQSTDVTVPRFWDFLGEAGRTVGVYNVPVTHPASPVNGFMVTGMLTPREAPSMTHPPSLYEELAARGQVPWRARLGDDSARRTARQALDAHEGRVGALAYLLRRFRPDFLMCVLQELDQIQHRFWPYCDRQVGGRDPAIRALVTRFFRRLDAAVGLLLEHFGPDARIFVVSDHGFGPLRRLYLLNRYLAGKGLLAIDWPRLRRGRARAQFLSLFLAPLRLMGLRAVAERLRRAAARGRRRSTNVVFTPGIRWARTRAAVLTSTDHALHVNLRGRFPQGIVEPGPEREAVLRHLVGVLEALRDPATGQPLATQIIRREEVFRGPFAAEAPDLYVVLDDHAMRGIPSLGGRLIAPSLLNGGHRMEGVFLASGPGIAVTRGFDADIIDVAPTVLYAAGLPVPEHMEGRVLTAAFDPAYVAAHPVRRAPTALHDLKSEIPDSGVPSQISNLKPPPRAGVSAADERALADRLRRLGYL